MAQKRTQKHNVLYPQQFFKQANRFVDNPYNNLTGKATPTLEYLRIVAEFSIIYKSGLFTAMLGMTGTVDKQRQKITIINKTYPSLGSKLKLDKAVS